MGKKKYFTDEIHSIFDYLEGYTKRANCFKTW